MNEPDFLQRLNDDLAAVVERTARSLVQVSNGGHSGGAGVIWREDGLILTNAHVVHHNAPRVTLADGRQFTARVLAHDPRHDLACLRIEANGLPAIELDDSQALRPGQWVIALGHPWGVVGAVSAGAVIGTSAQWPEMPQGRRDWVMVELNLRPGNSGGPLVNTAGRLAGINTIMTGPEAGAAVPVHVIKEFLDKALSQAPSPSRHRRRQQPGSTPPIV